MSGGKFGLKEARIGLWVLTRELRTCTPERAAVIQKQLPLYEAEIRKLTADPRDDLSAAEHADEAADLGNVRDVTGDAA